MDELLIPQFWGNGRTYHRCEDVRTEDRYETVVVQLRDSEGFRYGQVRMTREAALELAKYLTHAATMKERSMERNRKRIGPIDASPAAEARRRWGVDMTNMAVLHERVGGSRQDAPVFDTSHFEVYVKVMAALRMHARSWLETRTSAHGDAHVKEHVKDVITSLPDQCVLHLGDLWDDGETLSCAQMFMTYMRVLGSLRTVVGDLTDEIYGEAS